MAFCCNPLCVCRELSETRYGIGPVLRQLAGVRTAPSLGSLQLPDGACLMPTACVRRFICQMMIFATFWDQKVFHFNVSDFQKKEMYLPVIVMRLSAIQSLVLISFHGSKVHKMSPLKCNYHYVCYIFSIIIHNYALIIRQTILL